MKSTSAFFADGQMISILLLYSYFVLSCRRLFPLSCLPYEDKPYITIDFKKPDLYVAVIIYAVDCRHR